MTAQSKALVVYEIAKGKKISIPIEKESVWLSQAQMSELFGKDIRTVNEHIQNIFKEKELNPKSVIRKFRITAQDGKKYLTQTYNLDVIISVGYRVKSHRGTQFRIWATKVLRNYILKGYAINKHRIVDQGIDELERAVNLIRQTIDSKALTSDEAKGILKVISDYAHSWISINQTFYQLNPIICLTSTILL